MATNSNHQLGGLTQNEKIVKSILGKLLEFKFDAFDDPEEKFIATFKFHPERDAATLKDWIAVMKHEAFLSSSAQNYSQEFIVLFDKLKKMLRDYLPQAGIYCDIGGTLVSGDDTVRSDIKEKLDSFARDNRDITLITDGNVDRWTERLQNMGIRWPVKSKSELSGKKVEVLIDDMAPSEIKRVYNIEAVEYIQA